MIFIPKCHLKHVKLLADRLNEAVSMPFSFLPDHISVTSSIGISMYPRDGVTQDELIRHADMAMYEAKNQGENQYHFHK